MFDKEAEKWVENNLHSIEEEIYEYCINNGIPLVYGGLLLSYRH